MDSVMMKVILWTKYGGPEMLKMSSLEKPSPKEDEVLIRIHAATVTAGDCELRRFDIARWIWLPVRLYMGLIKPRIKVLGQEYAGNVEFVGNKVVSFKKGDQVFVAPGMKMGGYAEYSCLSENSTIMIMPRNASFAEAATIPTGGINGLHFIRKGKVSNGDKVLINGAGGSIGTYALQIAKLYGAEVTCVDSGPKLAMLTSIGSDKIVDYKQEDFTQNGETYDVIIDVVGKSSYSSMIKSLKKKGRLVLGNPKYVTWMLRAMWTSLSSDKEVSFALASENKKDLNYLRDLIENEKVKPVIDKYYSLDQVPEAHRYVEKGLKAGNVIIDVSGVK